MRYTFRFLGTLTIIVAIIYLLLLPACQMVYYLNDAQLKSPGIPKLALRLHQKITPEFTNWANERITTQAGSKVYDVAGSEWPLFSAAFYLWATEEIQKAYEKDSSILPQAPKDYAHLAIVAAAALLTDPSHAYFYKQKWGEDYLQSENNFFRTLLLHGLTIHYQLTDSRQYFDLLQDQANSLINELTATKFGWMDDFPNQCFPADVLMAYAAVKRADKVLDNDHSQELQFAQRGFVQFTDSLTGLPPYFANLRAYELGYPAQLSRGSSTALLEIFAPELWDSLSVKWFDAFEKHYWQKRWTAVGFREYSKYMPNAAVYDWAADVDAGPVIAGHGFTASVFGAGAARANGRFDLAYPLSAEIIALSHIQPNGRLFFPKKLSSLVDAPLVGELGILFNLTRQPQRNGGSNNKSHLPLLVYLVLAWYLLPALFLLYGLGKRFYAMATELSFKKMGFER